jgi:hypothetical protein
LDNDKGIKFGSVDTYCPDFARTKGGGGTQMVRQANERVSSRNGIVWKINTELKKAESMCRTRHETMCNSLTNREQYSTISYFRYAVLKIHALAMNGLGIVHSGKHLLSA